MRAAAAQPELPAAKVERNVVYCMHSGLALLMDVYHPANPNGYGLVHISGSGWRRTLDYDAPMITHSGHVKTEGAALVAAGYTLFLLLARASLVAQLRSLHSSADLLGPQLTGIRL